MKSSFGFDVLIFLPFLYATEFRRKGVFDVVYFSAFCILPTSSSMYFERQRAISG